MRILLAWPFSFNQAAFGLDAIIAGARVDNGVPALDPVLAASRADIVFKAAENHVVAVTCIDGVLPESLDQIVPCPRNDRVINICRDLVVTSTGVD